MTQEQLASMTDDELKAIRRNMPKYLNEMTPEQQELANLVYAEQTRRFKALVAEYNAEAEKVTGLKKGDRVSCFAPTWFGVGGQEHIGKVIYDRNGYLSVKLDHVDGSGRKIFPISKRFQKIS